MGFWLLVGFMGEIKVFHYRQNRGAFQVKILLTHNHSQKQNIPLAKNDSGLVAVWVQGRLWYLSALVFGRFFGCVGYENHW